MHRNHLNSDSTSRDINDTEADFAISLHCNAFNREASGTEVLYYHKSKTGEKIAKILQSSLVEALGINDRGIKPKTWFRLVRMR